MDKLLQIRGEYRHQQWQEIVCACQNSGLSNKEYCRQNGISEKSYYYWLRKMRKGIVKATTPQLVALGETPESERMIHIQFGAASMALPSGTDAEAIAVLLKSLQTL